VHIAHDVERPALVAQSQWISRFDELPQQSGFPLCRWPCFLRSPGH
jgi:hypothetical protein